MNKLREAAQAVIDAYFADEQWLTPYWDALRHALAEPESEYELWGIIMGSPGGRWVTSQVDTHKIYPVGTALWVKVGEKK